MHCLTAANPHLKLMQQHTHNSIGIREKLWSAHLIAAVLPFATAIGLLGWDVLITPTGWLVTGMALLGLLIAARITANSVRQAQALDFALQAVNQGDYRTQVEVLTNDELGHAAKLLNAVCEKSQSLAATQSEISDVERSIQSLLPQLKSIATGDLTVSADAKPGLTGEMSSLFNRMTNQMRSLVLRLQTASEQVDHSVTSIHRFSSATAQDSKRTADEINDASQRLLEMTQAFQSVTAQAAESVNVAVEARQTAADGLKAVNDTVQGMQRIRAQVQNTSQRIKRLGESSQEIGEIVQLISDITDRTSILALNASIQAAMAGDAGHGFAVVAEEVERLAERSASATGQVARLIRGIQRETKEVMMDMEESTREVVDGSRLATEAGETLFEIDSVSNQLVVMIEDVSESARLQAQNVNGVASAMQQICTETTTSVENTRSASQAVEQLQKMAEDLKTTLTRFQIPNANSRGTTTKVLNGSDQSSQASDEEALFTKQLRDFSEILQQESQQERQGRLINPSVGTPNATASLNQPSA